MQRTNRASHPLCVVAALMLISLGTPPRAVAQAAPQADQPAAAEQAAAGTDIDLSQRQSGVALRYQKLEELLLRLADVEAVENPERAALLRRAAKQSRDKFVLEKLRTAADSLRTQEFQNAVDNQQEAQRELAALLTLLQSEDRSKRIRDEKERYQRLIKDLKRNLNNQRSARARTENNAELDEVQQEQKAVTERSEELRQQLSDQQQADAAEADSSQSAQDSQQDSQSESQPSGEDPASEQQPSPKDDQPKSDDSQQSQDDSDPKSDEQKSDSQKSDSQQSDSQKSDSQQSESQKSESQKSDSQQSQDSQSQQSQQQPSESQQQSQQSQQQQQQSQQPSEQQQSQQPQSEQPQSPEQQVEQQLQQAIEKMRQAEKELEQAKRQEATEQQRQAEEKLRAAIDQLERILRQLREEEMQRELAKLEARLRKMASMQTTVLDDTVALAATPEAQRDRQTDLKAGNLAFEEKKITLEANRALLLLREEGSSVAFPEVVSQIRDDTIRVSDLLGQSKIDAVTQGIQQDILAALEEMIAALQKAQRDLEEKRQQQQQGQPQQGGQQEQPLVQSLAELKLIRTMETRIKKTTDRYAGLLQSGETSPAEVRPLLQELSDRQNRLYRITRDLVSKRNQ